MDQIRAGCKQCQNVKKHDVTDVGSIGFMSNFTVTVPCSFHQKFLCKEVDNYVVKQFLVLWVTSF